MLTKEEFVEGANTLREYWNWENQLYDMGIHLEDTAAAKLADKMLELLSRGQEDWDYDERIGTSWIATWCSAPKDEKGFRRGSQWVTLSDAGALYDFVSEMFEKNWPERVENWRFLG